MLTDAAPFEPRTARRSFVLAQSDYTEIVLLPQLLARLAAEAPGVDLRVVDLGRELPRRLESGGVDVAVHVIRHPGAGVFQRKLFADQYCCAVRADSRLSVSRLSVDEFASLRHVLVAPTGTAHGVVDDALATRGVKRRIVVSLPRFLMAPILVARSELCVTLPKRVAHALAATLPLRLFDPPISLPRFSVYMSWHERKNRDPAIKWLRNLLGQIAKSQPK
jgi:DNA-binding transcriptional LysR family regulator